MSTFLGFESLLIALGSTNQNVMDQFRTSLTGYGWQCPRRSLYPVATLGTLGTVANAFDSNPVGTSASSAAALPLWIGCQVANPFTPTVMYIQSGNNGTYFPSNFTLDWSDNGSSWTTHQTWTGEPNAIKYYDRRKYIVNNASAHAYWRLNVTARLNGTTTEINEWILEDASGQWITNFGFIDLMPPMSETIGNSVAREFIRMSISGTTINLTPMQELLQNLPAIHAFYGIAGAVTNSVTINGVTVSYVGNAASTAFQNARGLYEACRNSSDPNFLAYTWQWINYEYHFMCWKTTPTLYGISFLTATNITVYYKGGFCHAQPQFIGRSNPVSLTMDLTNGFIYYLQVNARGFTLATKTNAGYYGPVHCCYGDNASAIAQTPTSFIPAMPVTPIELIIGYNDISTNTGGNCRTSHAWVSPQGSCNIPSDTGNQYAAYNAWSGTSLYCNIQDGFTDVYGSTNSSVVSGYPFVCRSEGLFTGADTGTAYRIHRVTCDPDTNWGNAAISGNYNARGVGPVYNNLDWYRITGTLTDEQLVMIPSNDFTTTVSSSTTPTDVTINVASTTGFLSAGYIIINGEIIQYTGITGTSFTGCTRGKYATVAVNHFAGDLVNVGVWLVKINTGMVFAGYTKPV
jgi:hypothetical protein